MSLAQRRILAIPGLERSLMGRHPVSPKQELRSIIAELDRYQGEPGVGEGDLDLAADAADSTWDRYGDGGAVAALEKQVAAVLGKPAAVMFPSGTMAQQSVLRVWSDRQGSRRIALPVLAGIGGMTVPVLIYLAITVSGRNAPEFFGMSASIR